MPSYKTHTVFNVFLALPLATTGLFLYVHPSRLQLLSFVCAFVYTTLFMSPDMDLSYKIKWYSLRGFLSLPFRSYARVFRHRGISHTFFLGSLTRILWLFCAILILFGGYSLLFSKQFFFANYAQYKKEIFYGFLGVCLADMVHIFLDQCFRA